MGNWLLALFVCLQIGLLVVAWWKLSTEDNAWHTRTNAWASILTVFGIFGTFIGICLGLWRFEVTNIEGSIGPLLEGLKLAFLTSLVGILSSLILKSIALFQESKDQSSEAIETFVTALTETLQTVETSGERKLASQLETLTKTVEREGQETRKSLGGIKTDLTSIEAAFTEGQNATLTQLRILTTTFAEKHKLLVGEFRAFSQNLADSIAKLATQELIEAFKTVIEDFNTKISEQFGDNFKQLNEAVGRTVKWQEQYHQQLDKLASEFEIAAASIEQSRVSLGDIAERSSSIVACAENLEPILHTLNDQLEAFSKLRQNALNAFPRIENQLDDLTTKFSESVECAIKASKASAASQRVALKKQTEELDKALRKSTQHLIEQVEILDRALEEQLQKALKSLATQLTSLSKKFADDYLPLTDALRQVLTIAEGILPVDDNRS